MAEIGKLTLTFDADDFAEKLQAMLRETIVAVLNEFAAHDGLSISTEATTPIEIDDIMNLPG